MLSAPSIRVVSVDAHPLIHAGLRQFTGRMHDILIAGEAYDAHEAIALCERLAPDVVLIDVLLGAGEGIAAIEALKARFPHLYVVVLSATVDAGLVVQAMRAGASGYLLYTVSNFDLAQALRAVVAGRVAVAPEVTQQILGSLQQPLDTAAGLTEREQTILHYLVRGHTNAQIAQLVCLSRSTVKYYIASMFAKLGVTCRSELVALAYESRLVIPGTLDREGDRTPACAPRFLSPASIGQA